MKETRRRYQIYLLRCWAEPGQTPAGSNWRFSLEDPRTGRRHGFASLEALVVALQRDLSVTGEAADEVEKGL